MEDSTFGNPEAMLVAQTRSSVCALIEEFRKVGTHVQWLALWREARPVLAKTIDDSPEFLRACERIDALVWLISRTAATSKEDLAAQIEWFQEDLNQYSDMWNEPAFALVFPNLLAAVRNL